MKVILERIHSEDPRTTAELARDEVVEHRVELEVDGQRRTFAVFVRANVLARLDASMVYGDALLEELLRFQPEALNKLYAAVGKHRRGVEIPLPLLLADTTPSSETHWGASRP